jgi:peptidyl-prolyl cis-trans isomerase SurA
MGKNQQPGLIIWKNHMLSKKKNTIFVQGLLIVWILLFWTIAVEKAACDEVVDRIVAVVNNDIITYLELQKELQPYEKKIMASNYSTENEEKMRYKIRNEILNRMIEDKLTEQEAKRQNISLSEQEIDGSIEQIKAANMWTDEILREMLKREGMTIEAYRESVKERGIRARLVNSAVKSKIVVTKEDIRAYYESHVDRYEGELKYHLRNIIMMFPKGAGEAVKKVVFEKINKVYDKLKAGASFESLAEMYSESPLAEKGGDLGLISFEDISPRLQQAVKDLAVGQYTPVTETDLGYQILYLEDIARVGGKTFEEARPEIERQLYNDLVDEKFKTWLEDLRKNSHIKIIQ